MIDANEHDSIERARAVLRQYRVGALACDGRVQPRRFIIDPADGSLVLELTRQELDANEHVLHVPEEQLPGASDTSLQLLLSLEAIDPDIAHVCDRFIAAHGRRSLGRWARALIESGRYAGCVIPGEALMTPNPVRADEGALLRRLNADRSALARALLAGAGVQDDGPVAVACDTHGFDVRAGVGVVRVEFPSPRTTRDEIEHEIDAILGHSA